MKIYSVKRQLRKIKHICNATFFSNSIPPPYYKKHKLLREHFPSNVTLIETGTYLGETTEVLAQHCTKNVSIEPFAPLYGYNYRRFRNISNIEIIKGTSEEKLPSCLNEIVGDAGFWLDGHFSGKGTFGEPDRMSPILVELEHIKHWVSTTGNLVWIAIDDARLFLGKNGYPNRIILQDYAEKMKLTLREDCDIFFLAPAE